MDFQHLVRVDVDDLCSSENRFRWAEVSPIEMYMSVKMVTRLGNFNEPIYGLEAGMCLGVVVMYTEWWGMCDENIQCAPISGLIQEQLGQHFESARVGRFLCVLIRSVRAIEDTSAQAADQKIFGTDQFLIEV